MTYKASVAGSQGSRCLPKTEITLPQNAKGHRVTGAQMTKTGNKKIAVSPTDTVTADFLITYHPYIVILVMLFTIHTLMLFFRFSNRLLLF